MRATFSREERLKDRKSIEILFKEGCRISMPPVKILWKISETGSKFPAMAGFTIPKKIFRSAVERNTVKRIMREIYRKNKWKLYALLGELEKKIQLMFIFTGNNQKDLSQLDDKIISAINRLIKDIAGMKRQ